MPSPRRTKPDVFPTLFDSAWIGLDGAFQFRIPTYFAAIVAGWAAAAWLGWRDAEKFDVDRRAYFDMVIWMLIVGVFGARIMHVLFDGLFMDYVHLCTDPFLLDGEALASGEHCIANAQCLADQTAGRDVGSICNPADGLCYPMHDCFRALKFWAGGLTVYGAVIATVIFGWFYFRKNDLPTMKILDIGGWGIPLGIAIGRLGCLGAGCCFGEVCEVDWLGMRFPAGTAAYQEHFDHHHEALAAQWAAGIKESLPVWPTQALSSLYSFIIFAFVYFWVRPRQRFDGQLILTGGLLYAVARFSIEFVRADQRGGGLGLSTSQWVAIALGVACLATLVYKFRKVERDDSTTEDAD